MTVLAWVGLWCVIVGVVLYGLRHRLAETRCADCGRLGVYAVKRNGRLIRLCSPCYLGEITR